MYICIMTLQDKYQEDWSNKGYKYFQSKKCGLYDICQRIGKIKTTLLTINKLNLKNPKILVSYPDNKIKTSWENDVIKWGYSHLNIIYTNTSSLEKYINDKFDFCIIDECHVLSSKQTDEVSKILYNSKYALFLSGTIDTNTITSYKSIFNMGVITKYSTEQAIIDGILANYQITIHQIPLNSTIYKKNAKGKMINEVTAYKNYSFVIDLLKKTGKDFMSLALKRNRLAQQSINRIEYTKKLIHKINGRLIVFCGYEDNAKKIELPYESSKVGKGNILKFNNLEINKLALLQMGKMGVTYNKLDSLILASWDGNEATLAQTISRAVLLDYGDKIADIHIITSNEEPELKKLRNVLNQFPNTKIK